MKAIAKKVEPKNNPKPRKSHSRPEYELQKRCVQWLKRAYPHVFFTATVGGVYFGAGRGAAAQAVMLKAAGYCNGIPDLLIFTPCQDLKYNGLAIELKNGNRPLRPEQQIALDELVKCGWKSCVARSEDDFKQCVVFYMGLPPSSSTSITQSHPTASSSGATARSTSTPMSNIAKRKQLEQQAEQYDYERKLSELKARVLTNAEERAIAHAQAVVMGAKASQARSEAEIAAAEKPVSKKRLRTVKETKQRKKRYVTAIVHAGSGQQNNFFGSICHKNPYIDDEAEEVADGDESDTCPSLVESGDECGDECDEDSQNGDSEGQYDESSGSEEGSDESGSESESD